MEELDAEDLYKSAITRIRSLVEENRQLQLKLDECRQNGMAMLPHQIRLYSRLAQFMVEQNINLLTADNQLLNIPDAKSSLERFNADLNNYLSNHLNNK